MKEITLPRLRAEAKRQLLDYRRNHSRSFRSRAPRAERGAILGWQRAIDATRAYLREENPVKERFMSRIYGLDAPLPRSQPVRARMIRLSFELNVSESTLYKWREDILEVVLYAAIEAGLIGLFGTRALMPEEQDEANEDARCD
ncbi:MAG: hypothetical protein R2912_01665 [Eubacteriales bacterium]